MKHMIFYDGQCPLCNRVVRYVLARDKGKVFSFAPLDGPTADKSIKAWKIEHPNADTIVLVENFDGEAPRQWTEGKAAFRIFWLLGEDYRVLGLLAFLPAGVFNIVYRWVARNRYKLFSSPKDLKISDQDKERFFP